MGAGMTDSPRTSKVMLNPGVRVRLIGTEQVGKVDGWCGPTSVTVQWDGGHRNVIAAAALEPEPRTSDVPTLEQPYDDGASLEQPDLTQPIPRMNEARLTRTTKDPLEMLRLIVADARDEGRDDMRDSVGEMYIEHARQIVEKRTQEATTPYPWNTDPAWSRDAVLARARNFVIGNGIAREGEPRLDRLVAEIRNLFFPFNQTPEHRPDNPRIANVEAVAKAIYTAAKGDVPGVPLRAWSSDKPWDSDADVTLCEWERDEYREMARAAIAADAPRVDYVPTAFILRRGERYWTVPQVDRRSHYWTKDVADALRFGDRAQADAVVDAFDPDPDDPVVVEPAPRTDSVTTPEKKP